MTALRLHTIEIHNELEVEIDAGMLTFALQKVAYQLRNAVTIHLYVAERDKEGWLEWGMEVEYADFGKLFIGLIQRTPGASFESHT